jgi:Uma2 family endonuclease
MHSNQDIPRYTYNDYKIWEGDWELIHGYPYAMSPSPFNQHQIIGAATVTQFGIALSDKKKECNCKMMYEVDWIMNEDTVVRPDIMIVCGPIELKDFVRIPPSLIVEIASENTRLKDRNTKFKLYEQYGVKYYLIVDPDKKSIEYFQLVDNKYQGKAPLHEFELQTTCKLEVQLGGIFD